MGVVEPGAHHQPAAHTPEQSGDVSPGVEPYLPAGHGDTTPVPGAQYDPTGHVAAVNCVALVDPAAQKYPDAQGPEQSGEVSPGADPKRPRGHGSAAGALAGAQ